MSFDRKLAKEELDNAIVKALSKPKDNNIYRASSCGSCTRKLGYTKLGVQGTPPEARQLLTWDLGHTVEAQICDILEKAGTIKDRQREVRHTLPCGEELVGHIDCIYNGQYILDVKSSNTRGFAKITKCGADGLPSIDQIDESYLAQANLYMKALSLPFLFLYYNKDTSHLEFVELEASEAVYQRIDERYTKLKLCTDLQTLPDRDYKPNEKGVLPWNCNTLYCPYAKHCWPEINTEFVKGKPVESVK
jgi:hypothetical protein